MAREAARAPKRTPVRDQHRSRLHVQGKDPNFEYYIVNETAHPGKVGMMEQAGYEVVSDNEVSIGERRVAVPSQAGSAKTVALGLGDVGVLMKIRREYWEEDQAAKAAATAEKTAQMTKPADTKDMYGTVKISYNDKG